MDRERIRKYRDKTYPVGNHARIRGTLLPPAIITLYRVSIFRQQIFPRFSSRVPLPSFFFIAVDEFGFGGRALQRFAVNSECARARATTDIYWNSCRGGSTGREFRVRAIDMLRGLTSDVWTERERETERGGGGGEKELG